ncbi:ATP-binding protein [Streptomyces spiroverticillatus]|uniref:ATP-binding protein n=1 Tax=Streptomyces finlayi TaxID=67296 RepID=A0A918WW77_9ACTN|nr:ATP-binding protein [Streptomyces finlayi]GHA03656.1 ATP-binding protein [Streptomyces spiroverticillatus]GHC87793.1 ATP-binding protein [Streptomyces finlayi]
MNDEISTPTGDFTQCFSATRRGARLARRLATQQLDDWGIPFGSDVSDAVTLVVAELAANAATHGRVPGRDFQLRLQLCPYTIRIEVADARGEQQPPSPGAVVAPPPEEESGRGLLLVQEIAREWGVSERPVGKSIWAEVSIVPGAVGCKGCE